MIRESCSCGAYTHVDIPGDKNGTQEASVVAEWRKSHRHEAKINYLPPAPVYPQPSFTPSWTANETILRSNPTVYEKDGDITAKGNERTATWSKDSGWYAENTEWVWGEGNERVWVAPRHQPRDFEEWSKQWPKA